MVFVLSTQKTERTFAEAVIFRLIWFLDNDGATVFLDEKTSGVK